MSRYVPLCKMTREPHKGNVYEYLYVTEGDIQVTVEGRKI